VKFKLTPEMLMRFNEKGEKEINFGKFEVFTCSDKIAATFEIIPSSASKNAIDTDITIVVEEEKANNN